MRGTLGSSRAWLYRDRNRADRRLLRAATEYDTGGGAISCEREPAASDRRREPENDDGPASVGPCQRGRRARRGGRALLRLRLVA